LSRTLSQFVLHGNVRDVLPIEGSDGVEHVPLRQWLGDAMFGERDVVLFYDRSSGLSFADGRQAEDFRRALEGYDAFHGTEHSSGLPRDPASCLRILESYLKLRANQGRSLAVVIDYAESIVPTGEMSGLSDTDRDVLVTLQRWAHESFFLQGDITIVLLASNLADVHRSLLASPHVAAIEVPAPTEAQREAFLKATIPAKGFGRVSKVPRATLAKLTSGLKLAQLDQLVAEARQSARAIDLPILSERKKELIEQECHGLLEFIETSLDLGVVAGHDAAKELLRGAGQALAAGRTDVLPMGYLVCGPVGTGKTFLAKCFAGEIGVPCVVLKNFRSQWQGQTEANLERILTTLKALSPVLVVIDEADAYLGDRDSSGDSGVSSRVFSRIAAFMGDSEHRGRIVWALLTCRPDLLPVDLKRQGRAEEHVGLFYPDTPAGVDELYRVLCRKNGIETTLKRLSPLLSGERMLSGADVEAGLVRAKFRAAAAGRDRVTKADLEAVFQDFVPSTDPLAVELQTLAAVLECTSRSMVPEEYRQASAAALSARLNELKALLDD
jgi:SpoVK/Ycf46/Vps4 family AAA+-type ATPase